MRGVLRRAAGALGLCVGLACFFPIAIAAELQVTRLATAIPSQPLVQALESLCQQTGLQYVALDGVVSDQQSHGAPVGLLPIEALDQLLEGTGLHYEFLSERLVRIKTTNPRLAPAESLTLPEVLVVAGRIPKPFIAPASVKEQQAMDAANADLESRISHDRLLYGHAELDRYLQSVAARLLAIDKIDPASVRVRAIKGADANAFTLSNGSIYVTIAMLAALDDEAQLAAVLGHELTHYVNRHELLALREEKHQDSKAQAVGTAINLAAYALARTAGPSGPPPIIGAERMAAWARASMSGYSRDLERSADDAGIRRLISAGYDPSAALKALQHLSEQSVYAHAALSPKYASHPSLEERLASYRNLLAGELAAAAGTGDRRRTEYRAHLGELPLDAIEMLVEAGALDRAERLLWAEQARADSGRAEYLEGEIFRRRVPQTEGTSRAALTAYERAVTLPDVPASAYREEGLLHRQRGETEAAALAFQAYLEHAPTAVDAPLVRIYLDELRAASAGPGGKQ